MTSGRKSYELTYHEMKRRIELATHEHDEHPTYSNAIRLREAQLLYKHLEMEDRVKLSKPSSSVH